MATKKQATSVVPQMLLTVTAQQVAAFDRIKHQLRQLYEEISTLSKKSPDGAVNKFKLGFINEKLGEANELLGDESKPFRQFTVFDVDTLPTNSDVVMMLSQYLDALESWRSSRIHQAGALWKWYWNNDDGAAIETEKPSRYADR